MNAQTPGTALPFVSIAKLMEIEEMGSDELDNLPFGAIRLSLDGEILAFNSYESELSGRDPDDVIGRNFFEDVAPCTNVREFAGRFRDGVDNGKLNAVFPYYFDYEMDPRHVVVTLTYHSPAEHAWVFVRDRRDLPARGDSGDA